LSESGRCAAHGRRACGTGPEAAASTAAHGCATAAASEAATTSDGCTAAAASSAAAATDGRTATAAASGPGTAAATHAAAAFLRLHGAGHRHHERDRRDRTQNFKIDHCWLHLRDIGS
jgi:predicted amidohydrolase